MSEKRTDTIAFNRAARGEDFDITLSVSVSFKNSGEDAIMERVGKVLEEVLDDTKTSFFG